MGTEKGETLLAMTADIVAAHVANNVVGIAEIPVFIRNVYSVLSEIENPPPEPVVEQQPAVPIRASVRPDYIICLEDGRKLKMLRRYLRIRFDMSPEDYRTKWKLPDSYPMVAPNYSEQRRTLANAIGLGRKPVPAPSPKKRGRKPKATI